MNIKIKISRNDKLLFFRNVDMLLDETKQQNDEICYQMTENLKFLFRRNPDIRIMLDGMNLIRKFAKEHNDKKLLYIINNINKQIHYYNEEIDFKLSKSEKECLRSIKSDLLLPLTVCNKINRYELLYALEFLMDYTMLKKDSVLSNIITKIFMVLRK